MLLHVRGDKVIAFDLLGTIIYIRHSGFPQNLIFGVIASTVFIRKNLVSM